MTTDEIYEIAQKAKGECVTLGWFEGNIPCKENWREEVCYYVNHTVDEVEVFWYRKEDGRIIHNIKIVKNGDFDEIQSKKIKLSWIRKVNGKSVDMKYMNFKNDWGLAMLNLKEYIMWMKKICKQEDNYNCSSYFDQCWKDIVFTMIKTRDYNKTYSFVMKQRYYRSWWKTGQGVCLKTWDKLMVDLKTILKKAYEDNELYKESLGVSKEIKNQLFQFLHNLFLTVM
jgi:hypothetical protein